ncbi:RE1 [Symbiodinium natans]|uniref:RE1 protein n=1 Tax=Symbiodinium natans TaxID=878477 RepID=A0A812UVN1_9DINO|nr:RE1 [Symbiodinium natans]
MPNIPSMTQPTSGGQDDLSAAEAEDDEAADSERESDRQMYGEDDMDPSSHPAYVVEDEDEDELLAEPPRGGSGQRGRNGLRTAAASSSSSAPKSSPLEPAKARGAPAGSDDKSKSQRKPRGNLPPAPAFDGDKKKDPKCFRKWSAKVDSYVEIAKNIIDDSEIGLRLHAALDGDAADYLEDIPARTFGVEKGWQVLLRVLKEKFDEKRMHKVGSAMRGFFRLNLGDKSYSMLEVADAMDKAARRCREANLTIPDEIMIYFFFEHTQSSTERQANLLLRTGGEYNWKKMKAAVELLYQNVNVRPTLLEVVMCEIVVAVEATEEQVENWIYDLDPVEQLASAELEEIPEDLARELHLCFATHRENRQKLARAVQARGFYVGQKGKGKGKSKYDSKGKSKDGKGKKGGGGKARGMSLEELKSKTQCADCGQRGHWRGDPQCKGARSNNAVQRDGLDDDDEAQDWYEDYDRDVEYPSWAAERYGYEAHRSSYVSARREPGDDRDRRAEAEAVARGVDRVRRKAEPSAPAVNADQVKAQLTSDTFLDAEAVKSRIQSMHRPHMTPSQAPELVAEAFRHFGLEPVPSGRKGVRELLDEDTPGPDIESLRRALVTRRADFSLERAVCSSSRRPPTVEPNRLYLTLDTACENTVAGVTLLRSYAKQLETNYGVHVKIEAESEHYCFGPGPPLPSKERWSFPLGIGGEQAVIHTSAVEDTHSPKVPFLAGQDWMKFMDACLDIGRDRALLREIGIEVPLFVDTTGHLVIAIDEFPAGGWAAGLKPQKEGYAGATFGASDVAATAFAARKETVLPDVSQVACGTTHFYVPCLMPRVALFEPQDAIDGPDPESLQPLRVTVCSALPVPLRDEWGGQSATSSTDGAKKTHLQGLWFGVVTKMLSMFDVMVRWEHFNKKVMDMKYRSPALMGYVQAIVQEESSLKTIPATLIPPAVRNQKPAGQPAPVQYPTPREKCRHPPHMGRKTGNTHGRFLECAQCGTVWKGVQYRIPVAGDMVTAYPRLWGHRDIPGGKIVKGKEALDSVRQDEASSASLSTCYSCSQGCMVEGSKGDKKANKAKAAGRSTATSSKNIAPTPSSAPIPMTSRASTAVYSDLPTYDHEQAVKYMAPTPVKGAVSFGEVLAWNTDEDMEENSEEEAAEQSTSEEARWPRKRFGCDLLEVFGGTSMISVRATAHWGMRVLQPIDIRCGCDLKKPKERQWLLRVLDRLDPRLVVVAIPCTAWSVSQADEELALRREYVQPFAKLADDVFRSQRRRGGHAVAESPATSHGFQKAEYQLRQDLYETASCVSMPQLTDKNGRLGQKRLRFVATHPYCTWALDRQCATTVAYPPALADAICQAYWEVVAQEDYGFATTWEAVRAVHYVDVKRDEAGWRDMLTQAQELLGRKNQASLLIPPGTDFHSKIESQSHRASVLLLNDDSVQIETEYIRECQAPRERFVTPVRYAIFVLGHAPGEPSGPASARPPTRQPLPAEPGENVVEPGQMVQDVIHEGMIQEGVVQQSFAGEIWFIGGPLKEKEKAIARSLVRAHRNLGHPRAEDFTRALAQNYRVSPEAISLSRRLRCATCERTKRPHPPRPSSLKMTGPFNSRVCLDFVHLHDADKEGHWFLHIVEPNGSFNVFYPVESRNPEHVFETFCNIWASWAGWPDAILVDQDGGFGAYFAEQLVNVGTEIEHIAAEAHWQAGQVETFNRAFRYAAAKLIDEHHITGRLGMKMLASSVGASMNDRVRTSGCSANEWVFGKHPKVPVDLLSPDGKLQALQGMDADQELRLRQQIRASADAKLAEFSVNQSLSKAILRLEEFLDIRAEVPDGEAGAPGEVIPFFDDNIEDAPNELPGLDAQAAAGEGEHREGDGPLPERYEHGTGSLCGSDRTQPSPTAREDRPSGLEEPEAKRFRSEVVEVDTPEPELDEAAEAALEAALGKGVNITTVYVPVSVEELFAKPSQPFQESVLAAGTRAACATRKEAKALEKEIPFNQIPFEQKDSYAAALQKEWDTWTKYAAVEILSPHASQVVLEQYDSSRILDTRVCYRNKNAPYPWLPLKAKARLVCRGDRDPDLLTLRRDAPTLTRLGLMVILQIAASLPSWFLFNADVTGAFLQGDQSLASRKEPLFLRQPREGLPGLVAGQILLVVRGIFGLANSPRLFWRHLRDTLLKLGFVQSVLDKALFAYYHLGQLVLLMGAHVDDLIGAGEPGGRADEVLAKVKEAFDFGSWADSRTDEVLEYGGKQVRRLPDGRVQLTQEKFIQATNLTPVPKWRSIQPNSELTGRETTELRSAGGCLHWLIGQTRPDLAAGTSLFMSGKPTVSNLLEINKLLKEAKKSQDWGLCFSPVPLDQAKVVVFSDASWANAEGLKSQAGYLSFLTGPDVFSPGGDTASLMDWRSHRIQRQCRSTLAAETMSLDTAFDSGIFLRELLAEVLLESYSPVQSGALPKDFLPVHPVTDCRSLYDLLVKDGPVSATQEKRLTIDLGAIKQSAEEFDPEDLKGTFKWVDTSRQLADHLTKLKPSYQLREHLEQGWLALQVDVQNDARDQGSHPAS